jgi:hypothetical protein
VATKSLFWGRLAIGGHVPYAPALTMRLGIASLLAAMAVAGCQQHIGDACGSSSDCSATGERQCDLAQPGGYCTVFSCDPDTCPEGACVEWRFNPSRTAETWCMETCSDDGICRGGYNCVRPAEIDSEGFWQLEVEPDDRIARIIDINTNANSKICTALTEPVPERCRVADPPPDCE